MTYYLSEVKIDQDNRQKIKDLSHLGAYHNWVETSFPTEIEGHLRKRHLWRIDPLKGNDFLLVLSENKPDLHLLSKYGVPGTAQTKKYDNFVNRIYTKEIMRFRLTANPVHRVTAPGQKKGKIYPHVTIEQQKKWLLDRSTKNGFEILKKDENLAFDIVNRDFPILYHHNGHKIKLSRVSFEGILKVINLIKFKKALLQGIGREKAYGMGLITVIPLKGK